MLILKLVLLGIIAMGSSLADANPQVRTSGNGWAMAKAKSPTVFRRISKAKLREKSVLIGSFGRRRLFTRAKGADDNFVIGKDGKKVGRGYDEIKEVGGYLVGKYQWGWSWGSPQLTETRFTLVSATTGEPKIQPGYSQLSFVAPGVFAGQIDKGNYTPISAETGKGFQGVPIGGLHQVYQRDGKAYGKKDGKTYHIDVASKSLVLLRD